MRIRWGILGTALLLGFLTRCGVNERFSIRGTKPAISGTRARGMVYEPTFYIYRNGRYTFIEGGYRKVRFGKAYYKRSLRGYRVKGDYASSR